MMHSPVSQKVVLCATQLVNLPRQYGAEARAINQHVAAGACYQVAGGAIGIYVVPAAVIHIFAA